MDRDDQPGFFMVNIRIKVVIIVFLKTQLGDWLRVRSMLWVGLTTDSNQCTNKNRYYNSFKP